MKTFNLLLIALLLAFSPAYSLSARAQNVCNKLSEDEVAAAVGTPLKRSPTNPCRFGFAFKSFSIIIHAGDGPRFADYAANARREFKDTQTVSGIGSEAIFFGFNLAVKAKGDVIFIQMLMGHSADEKIRLSKAVVQALLNHY
ncbi:MAG: hypothetical protein ABSG00_08380 [Terracidiphilus sp.]|jgi:hypothetical protein